MQNDFKAEILAASVLCVVLAVVLDAVIVGVQWLVDSLDPPEARDMRNLGDAWDYLTTSANWKGDDGIWHLLVQQLLLSVTALAIAMVIGLTFALWLGPPRPGRLPHRQHLTNIGRAVPTFALLAILVTPRPSRAPPTFGPYGRAGLATLIALSPVRAAADLHQRVRRRPTRCRPRSRSRPAGWA